MFKIKKCHMCCYFATKVNQNENWIKKILGNNVKVKQYGYLTYSGQRCKAVIQSIKKLPAFIIWKDCSACRPDNDGEEHNHQNQVNLNNKNVSILFCCKKVNINYFTYVLFFSNISLPKYSQTKCWDIHSTNCWPNRQPENLSDLCRTVEKVKFT